MTVYERLSTVSQRREAEELRARMGAAVDAALAARVARRSHHRAVVAENNAVAVFSSFMDRAQAVMDRAQKRWPETAETYAARCAAMCADVDKFGKAHPGFSRNDSKPPKTSQTTKHPTPTTQTCQHPTQPPKNTPTTDTPNTGDTK